MIRIVFLLLLAGLVAGGCANTQALSNDPSDPWEGFNRNVYQFNDSVDRAFLVPAATTYRSLLPEFAKAGVSNFFSNVSDIGIALNNILQLKFLDAASDTGRILVNSTVGLLGLLDVASHMGLQKNNEDFGQTLAFWGVGTGPYVVLPLLGPSNLRDGPAKVVDFLLWAPNWTDINGSERGGLLALNVVKERTELMQLEEKAGELSRDRYIFIRDAYLDNRAFLASDGAIVSDTDLYEDL